MPLCLMMVLLSGCASSATVPGAEKAGRVISCIAGPDCDAKWSRAMQWLQQNSSWKVTTATDMLLTTEGPLTTAKPAFEVTKVALRDGSGFEISMRAWCGTGDCDELIERLRDDFSTYVLTP